MKKILCIIPLVIVCNYNVFSQVVVGSKFKPFSYEEMAAPVRAAQQKYDEREARYARKYKENERKVDELIDWIFDLKDQTNDAELLSSLDKYYQTLKTYYDYDLALMDKEIRNISLGIREDINSYNKRIVENSPLKGKQAVSKFTPLYEKPDMNSETIGNTRDGYVYIISQVNSDYYYVKTIDRSGKEIEGYLWSMWVKK